MPLVSNFALPAWLAVLDSAGLREACAYARLRRSFVDALEAERPRMRLPECRARLERLHERLFARGEASLDEIAAWPPPGCPDGTEVFPPLFYAFLLLAGIPCVRAGHAVRRVPEEVTRETLSDLDRWIEDHRLRHGYPGLTALAWLHNHFTGRLLALGRLQFRFEDFPEELAALAPAPHPGAEAPVLSVHVPASGPLDPAACDRSLREAAKFFPRHYPDRPVRGLVCYSWLLDPALAEHLPADCNIMNFQRRFALFPLPRADDAPFRALFPEAWSDPRNCHPKSALQAALRDRLLAGKSWAVHGGILRLAETPPSPSRL